MCFRAVTKWLSFDLAPCSLVKRAIQSRREHCEAALTSLVNRACSAQSTRTSTSVKIFVAFDARTRLVSADLQCSRRDCIALFASEQSEGSDKREPHSDSSKRDEGGRASPGAARKSGGSKDFSFPGLILQWVMFILNFLLMSSKIAQFRRKRLTIESKFCNFDERLSSNFMISTRST